MTEEQEATTVSPLLSVKTDVFEGPLDLLLDLIEKRKLLINDISIAEVTDEYMAHVAKMEQNPLHVTTQFVNLASTLLLIKSRSLLPVLELTETEEETIEDLQDRLRLYKIYKDAGITLRALFGKKMTHRREFVTQAEPIFTPDAYATLPNLSSAIKSVLSELPQYERKQNVSVRKTISLEDTIESLRTRIERQMRLTLKDFTSGSAEKGSVIVGFLAVLEMVKQGVVLVSQTGHFEDIEIEKEGGGAPRYM